MSLQYVTAEITMKSGNDYGIVAEGTTQREILKDLMNSFTGVVLNEKDIGEEIISVERVCCLIIR